MHNLLKCLDFHRVVFCSRVAPCCSAYHYCITVYHSTKPELRLAWVQILLEVYCRFVIVRTYGNCPDWERGLTHFRRSTISLSSYHYRWKICKCEGWPLGWEVVKAGYLDQWLWMIATWVGSCEGRPLGWTVWMIATCMGNCDGWPLG